MPDTREDLPGRSWASHQNNYINASGNNQPEDNFIPGEEVYGISGRYPTKATLSENYTVLPVGHGNFLKLYRSNEGEPPAFNSYELFSSSSILQADNGLPQQNTFDNPSQFQSNETTNMIINQLVTNWSPNLSGTYSPFGEQGGLSKFAANGANANNTSNETQKSINKTVGVNNFKANTNGNFGNNSSNMTEVKKRIVAEVKPMRMSYSDVLSKNVAFNPNNTAKSSQGQNSITQESSNQLRNSKIFNEKVKSNLQAADRKILDDKEKTDFKMKKDSSSTIKVIESSAHSNGNQKDRKRISLDEKESMFQNKQQKKSQDANKSKIKNFQSSNLNSKKKSNKRDNENGDIKSSSKSNEKEFFYNIAKNDSVGEKYQKNFQHGNLKKRQVNSGQRNSSRNEKIIYTKRIQRQQRDMKYDLIAKFFEKWYEYTSKILVWLFYLIYDIIVLGFGMVMDWAQTFYYGMCNCFVNVRKDLKNNSGKPSVWIRNIFKKIDGIFKKNSKLAFWRSFYKKRHQESIADFYKNGRLPQTGDEAMYSLLNCKGKDAYSILGVSADSSQEQIRKHYKKIAVLVHPDKNKQPGAEEAFKVLQRAFELIGEPENRKSYDQSLAEALHAEKAWTELHDLLSQLQSKIAEAANTIRCSSCGLRHPRKLTERPHYAARECSSCKISHSAREGDIWAETSVFGLRWKYFALMEGKVYDITEWANCQKGALAHLQPNSHIVQYRIVRGGQQQQQNAQQEKDRPPNPPSEPSLDDFLDNLYSGQNPQNQQNSFSRRRTRRN